MIMMCDERFKRKEYNIRKISGKLDIKVIGILENIGYQLYFENEKENVGIKY